MPPPPQWAIFISLIHKLSLQGNLYPRESYILHKSFEYKALKHLFSELKFLGVGIEPIEAGPQPTALTITPWSCFNQK